MSPFASSPSGSNDDIAINAEVSKYPFLIRLKHYMNGERILLENCKSIMCAILFEVGIMVRNMDCMKKDKQEAYYIKYLTFVKEIKDNEFVSDDVCQDMLLAYKGSKKV